MAKLSCAFLALAFGIAFASQTNAQSTKSSHSYDEEIERIQPGRIESAEHIIAQAEKFKLNAKQYHLNANDTIKNAKSLKGQADKLNAMSGAVDKNSPKEFQIAIDAFKDHAKQYHAHLDTVEQSMGYCKASEAAYQANLKELSLHTERFHIASIRPPHVCGQMDLTSRESSHVANSMRTDAMRVALSEQELANSEAKLGSAIDSSRHATEALGKRNNLQEEERKLAGEFARLKTEYELLDMQRTALLGKPLKSNSSTATVQGKIKK